MLLLIFVKLSINGSMSYYWIKILVLGMVMSFKLVLENEMIIKVYVCYFKWFMVENYEYVIEVLDFILCKECKGRGVKEIFYFLLNKKYFNCIKDLYLVVFLVGFIEKFGIFFIGIWLLGFDLFEIRCRWCRVCFENGR